MTRSDATRAIGIRDVARVAGVSPPTVSRVLNGRASSIRISADTIDRVRTVVGVVALEGRYITVAAAVN